jgi:mannitol-1-phosphate/altronate dehydrogenase
MRKVFLDVLKEKYKSEYNEHRLAVEILMEKCVGISDHTNFIDEADKHISAMAHAVEKIDTVDELLTNNGEWENK